MGKALKALIVEDSESDAALIMEALIDGGYEPIPERVETPEEMKSALQAGHWDVVLSDYRMPRFNALQAMRLIRESGLDLPFIIITGSIGEELAAAAMKAGANDYLMKDNLSRLAPAIDREIQEAARRRAYRQAEVALQQSEERFRQLAESIQGVFWMRDLGKNKILYVSPSYEKIWGRSCEHRYEPEVDDDKLPFLSAGAAANHPQFQPPPREEICRPARRPGGGVSPPGDRSRKENGRADRRPSHPLPRDPK